jgi:hypothetical protein
LAIYSRRSAFSARVVHRSPNYTSRHCAHLDGSAFPFRNPQSEIRLPISASNFSFQLSVFYFLIATFHFQIALIKTGLSALSFGFLSTFNSSPAQLAPSARRSRIGRRRPNDLIKLAFHAKAE